MPSPCSVRLKMAANSPRPSNSPGQTEQVGPGGQPSTRERLSTTRPTVTETQPSRAGLKASAISRVWRPARARAITTHNATAPTTSETVPHSGHRRSCRPASSGVSLRVGCAGKPGRRRLSSRPEAHRVVTQSVESVDCPWRRSGLWPLLMASRAITVDLRPRWEPRSEDDGDGGDEGMIASPPETLGTRGCL
jgi:hypothetical protein